MHLGSPLEPQQQDVISDINMTPLVDVMLVLLIIFMVTVPVLTHSVRIELPRASVHEQLAKPRTITLSVDKDAVLRWDTEVLSRDELERRLKDRAADSPQPDIHIRGDRTVGYEHVMHIMAAVQRAGLTKIGFISEPEKP